MKVSTLALISWVVVAVGISVYFWYNAVFGNCSQDSMNATVEENNIQATRIGQFTDTMTCNGVVITQCVGIYKVRGKNNGFASTFASGFIVPNKGK